MSENQHAARGLHAPPFRRTSATRSLTAESTPEVEEAMVASLNGRPTAGASGIP
jgi:hypothetical protein